MQKKPWQQKTFFDLCLPHEAELMFEQYTGGKMIRYNTKIEDENKEETLCCERERKAFDISIFLTVKKSCWSSTPLLHHRL